MPSKKRTLKIILWSARILGTLALGFLLFITFAEVFNSEEKGLGLVATKDKLSFIFFPLSTIIGLLLAYKFKGLGGMITVGGMICLHIVRPDLASNLLISVLAIPGLLYIIYSVWSKN